MATRKPREDTISSIDGTIPGLAPAPHEREACPATFTGQRCIHALQDHPENHLAYVSGEARRWPAGDLPTLRERETSTTTPAELEALRGRRCLDAMLFALARRMGTDELDELLIEVQRDASGTRDWSKPRRIEARRLAEALFTGSM